MDGFLTRADSWLLIELVKERRTLWDHTDPDFMKQGIQYDLWNEVAAEMNKPIEKVKIRWRSLRDRFRKELKKCSNKGIDPDKFCKWAYFQKMAFMKSSVLKSLTSPFIIYVSDDDMSTREPDDGGSQQSVNVLTSANASPGKNQTLQQQPFVSHSTPKNELKLPKIGNLPSENTNGHADKLLEYEERQSKNCVQDDGDYEFLMSLLPYMIDIPKSRKLGLRAKLLQTLIEEQQSFQQK